MHIENIFIFIPRPWNGGVGDVSHVRPSVPSPSVRPSVILCPRCSSSFIVDPIFMKLQKPRYSIKVEWSRTRSLLLKIENHFYHSTGLSFQPIWWNFAHVFIMMTPQTSSRFRDLLKVKVTITLVVDNIGQYTGGDMYVVHIYFLVCMRDSTVILWNFIVLKYL